MKARLLHLGFGAFARAHVLRTLDAGNRATQGDWGAVVARLSSGRAALDALDAAGGVYHVAEADDAGVTLHRIGCVLGSLHPARDGADALPARIAHPDLAAITLTITEKGYCAAGGTLDTAAPAIRDDLSGAPPRSAIGVLAEGLARRRAAGLGGLTLVSCDNLPENGRLLQTVLTAFARHRDPGLADWIGAACTFPSSMVDRIVPALDDAGRATLRDAIGRDDPNGIVCEPFRQWVIEDRFAGPRPPLAQGGAQVVDDVRPFEAMKLRMLNGAHSFIAWIGLFSGHATVADAMRDPALAAAVRHLMLNEQAPTLPPLPGIDLPAYAEALLARFRNGRLRHATAQIATDSSQKVAQRILAPVAWHLDRGTAWPALALALAAWFALLRGQDAAGRPVSFPDPLAQDLHAAAQGPDGAAHVARLLGLRQVVPSGLAARPGFAEAVTGAYLRLRADGPAASLSALSRSVP